MLRTNNMARAVGRAFSSTYARLEKAAIAAARRNDAMLLYVPDNPSNVLQFSAGYTPSTVGTPIGRMLDMQYGAPTLGPELLPNTRFTDDYSGWTSVLGTVSVVSGRLRTTRGVSTGGRAAAAITCIPGRTYRVTADRYLGGVSSAGLVVAVSSTSTVGNILSNYGITGPFSAVFIATQTSHWIALDTGTGAEGQYCEYDNVSVKEVIEAPASRSAELLSNGDFAQWSGDNPVGWGLSMAETATEYVTQGSPGLRLVSTLGNFTEVSFAAGCVVGKTYEAMVVVSACTGTGGLANQSQTPITFTAPGIYRAVFVASNASVSLKRAVGGAATDFTVTLASLKEVFGYHGSQATAANKPTLVRIPRKSGPDLITPGAWTTGTPTSTTISAGVITLAAQFASAEQPPALRNGTYYNLSYSVTAASGSSPLALSSSGFTGSTTTLPSAIGINTVTVLCVDATKPIRLIAPNAGTSITLTAISLREIQEWSNAIQLDGTDDWLDLTYRSYYNAGASTFICAHASPISGGPGFLLTETNTANPSTLVHPLGVTAANLTSSYYYIRNDAGSSPLDYISYAPGSAAKPCVISAVDSGVALKGFTGGAQSYTGAYVRTGTLTTNRITLGAAQRTAVGQFAKAVLGLICWSANVMPDADRKAIERFGSYLVGEPYV